MLCGGESFSPGDAYDSALGQREADEGKIHHQWYLQYQGVRWLRCRLHGESFSPDGAYDYAMGQRKFADEGNIHHQLHPVPRR